MNPQPEMLPFAGSVALSLLLAGFALQHRDLRAARTLGWLMIAIALWTGCYAIAWSLVELEDKRVWEMAKYLGAATAPVIWLLFLAHVIRADSLLDRRLLMGLWAWAAVVLVGVLTNSLHGLFWVDMWLEPGRFESQVTHGPLFMLYEWGVYAAVVGGIGLSVWHLRTAPRLYRAQAVLLLTAAALPLVGRLLQLVTGFELIEGVDSVPLLLCASGVLFSVALFRYDALDVLTLANRLVIDQISAGVIVLDHSGCVLSMNPYARGLCRGEVREGVPLDDVLPEALQISRRDGSEQEIELPAAGPGEAPRCFLVRVSRIGDAPAGKLGHALMLLDISSRKDMERALESLASTDLLTGAANRRKFMEQAGQDQAQRARLGGSAGLLMIDVDHFKAINEQHGHAVGDEVLRNVARVCMEVLREIDLFARFGGKEFIALVSGDSEAVCHAGERVRSAVAELVVPVSGRTLSVTCSIRVAMVEGDLQQVIDRADAALHAARRDGRNRVVLAAPGQGQGQG